MNANLSVKFEYTRWMFDDFVEGDLRGAGDRVEYDDVDRFSLGLALVY